MKNLITFVLVLLLIGGILTYPKIKKIVKNDNITEVNKTEQVDSLGECQADTVKLPLLMHEGHTCVVAELGGYPMRFTLDTGFEGVRIGNIEYQFLLRQGVISENPTDISTLTTTSGEEKETMTFISTIKIGGVVVKNVNIDVCIKDSLGDRPVLGHSLLMKLGKISIDYNNKFLIINK